ncbi:hypothetical protein BJ878DRAFT_85264 [Calycina marina]|uniref:Uncharacterized protein n=1 Tax=Calycina marina TaxID=1763456 RepID=A0A9P7Z296_9HELO|nr:hypothetical protein BJ878DRAFT_85264 [Calycina marina]
MVAETIFKAPMPEDFQSKEEYDAQTPASFHDGKPVLHCHVKNATITMTKHLFPAPAFLNVSCASNPEDETRIKETVDIYVSNKSYIIFNHAIKTGLSIPYPDVPIAGIQKLDEKHSMMFCLDCSGTEDSYREEPPSIALYVHAEPSEDIDKLYKAFQVCSDLNPDPPSQGDEDMEDGFGDRIAFEGNVGYTGISGLPGAIQGAKDGQDMPPVFPGSSGWITADNVDQFFDEDGMWLAGKGPNTGETRSRDDADDENDNESKKRSKTTGA